jgi:hypothetical protein
VDQAEPENQVIPWHHPERRIDTDLGGHVLLPAVIVHQVPDEILALFAGTDSYDRSCTHRASPVDRYFVSYEELSLKKVRDPVMQMALF